MILISLVVIIQSHQILACHVWHAYHPPRNERVRNIPSSMRYLCRCFRLEWYIGQLQRLAAGSSGIRVVLFVQQQIRRCYTVYNPMRRGRFIQKMRFLHCALNQNQVIKWPRPSINKIKENFLEYYVPAQKIAYDQSMIEYFTRHGCKQYIRGKPIRFVWRINSKSGYHINFEVFQGCIPNSNKDRQKKFGKAPAPHLYLFEEFPE